MIHSLLPHYDNFVQNGWRRWWYLLTWNFAVCGWTHCSVSAGENRIFWFRAIIPYLVDKPVIYRIRGTLFTSTLDMNFLDRYHKAVTPSGAKFDKDLMSFRYRINYIIFDIEVVTYEWQECFSIDFLWLIWHVPGGRIFWADAGPTSVLLSRSRAIGSHVFPATWDISWRIFMVLLHIAFCGFVHCVFIFPCFVSFVVWP